MTTGPTTTSALVKGERIVKIDKEADGSGVAHASSGRQFPFKRLALTVGARARKLEIDGGDLDGVLYLRNADDALALKARVGDAHDVVVIGGGFIGLEAASSLHEDGQERHRARIRAAAGRPRRRRGDSRVLPAAPTAPAAWTSGSTRAPDDSPRTAPQATRAPAPPLPASNSRTAPCCPRRLVLVGIGVIPNTELAEQLGLDRGQRDRGGPFRAGLGRHHGGGRRLCQHAEPGARSGTRGADPARERQQRRSSTPRSPRYSLTGRREEYAGIPWFWSNQADLKLQIAGLCQRLRPRPWCGGTSERGKFSVLYYRQGQIIAADCVNAPLDFMAVKNALAKGQNIPADAAADPARPLKTIATDS